MITTIKPNNEYWFHGYDNPLHSDEIKEKGYETIDISNVPAEKFKGGYAIQDDYVTRELVDYMKSTNWNDFYVADGVHPIQLEYMETFKRWAQSSKLNNIKFNNLSFACITNGTSEAFSMFMLRHNQRRFKFFKGDFMMHKVASNIADVDWEWIDDNGTLEYGDALIVSCPFSDTARFPHDFDRWMDLADKCEVPVLLDMAYFGTCVNIDIDTERYPAIEEIVFSLGKTFPIIGARAGIRFQKVLTDDPVTFANQNGIVNNFACKIGTHCMINWSPDYIPYKYYDAYNDLCLTHDFLITNSVLWALSDDTKYMSINRGNELTRLCLSKFVKENYDNSQAK